MRSLLRAIAVCCLLPAVALARPVTIDDLLHLEELGPVVIDPSGRWAVIETQIPFDQSSRFEDWPFSRNVRARLQLVDLAAPAPARPAFPQDDKAGYIAGPFSPSGRSMIVFRDIDRRREAGVLTLGTGQVRWLGVGADMEDHGATVVWRSDLQILMIALAADDRPYQDKAQVAAMLDLPGLWRSALTGEASSVITNGSGRYRDVHPQDPDRRLLQINVATGATTVLATGPFESLALSRSGRKVALMEALERVQPMPDQLIGPGYESRRHNLLILDLDSALAVRPCPSCDVMRGSLRWSNGDDLLLFARQQDQLWPQGRFLRLDQGASEARPLETFGVTPSVAYLEHMLSADIHAEWLGADPLIYGSASTSPSQRSDWFRLMPRGARKLTGALPSPPGSLEAITEQGLLLIDGDAVWAVASDGTARKVFDSPGLKRLSRPTPYTTSRADRRQASAERGALVYTSSGNQLSAVDVGYSGIKWRIASPSPIGSATSAVPSRFTVMPSDPKALNASSRGLVTMARDAHGVQEVSVTLPDGRSKSLVVLNPQFSRIEPSTPIAIDAPGPTGQPFKDYLYLPPNAKPGERYPVVVIGYPGDVHTSPNYNGLPAVLPLDDNVQLVTAQGFAVLCPSIFTDPKSSDFSAGLTRQTLDALDRAAATGLVDPNAAAFWGHSAGGYMALVIATQTNRFKAIIAAAPLTDYLSSYGQTRPAQWIGTTWPMGVAFSQGWAELGQGHTLATPWTNLDRYISLSPVFKANEINTPILIAQGDQDYLSFAQGQEMFAALYRLKKDALFVAAFGEGHEIMSPANARAYYKIFFSFLDSSLRNGPR